MQRSPQVLAATLATQGFAVVPGLVSPQELAELRAAFTRLEALARTGGDAGTAEIVVEHDPFRLHRVVWCGGAEPGLAAFGGDPRFLELAATALNSRELVQLIQQAHFKLPGDGVAFRWHQDASNRRYGTDLWTDLDGRGSFVQIALAIDPMTPASGGLEVVPGSHQRGFMADPLTGDLAPVSPGTVVGLALDPGDAVVFGPFLVHGSGPNQTDQPRRLFLQGYALPGANRRVYPGCGTGVARAAG